VRHHPPCHHEHPAQERLQADSEALEQASLLFRALGDAPRLRLLEYLIPGECCVSELVEALGEKFSTVSQRLRLLRSARLVVRRREGTHLYYALADEHVSDLIRNALAHAAESESGSASARGPDSQQGAKK
jgi:ArsR family transcriptional regulator